VSQARGYPASLWASYKQWQQLGAQVRKGEHGAMVVFYKRVETESSEPEDHDKDPQLRFFARRSWVFNVAQVDGWEDTVPPSPSGAHPIGEVEAFVQAVNATVCHGYATARYRPRADLIEMPNREWFPGSELGSAEEAYYSVLLHELTHWSGAPHRLNRTFGKRYGDDAYAFEELVAELGAAFMCAAFGISTEPRPDHAGYVSSWLRVLKNDVRAIFTAASKAQEAFEHLAYLATRNDS
jgi:antirestriction protein ArdC